ncbi:MAG: DUF5719 family protein [Candidatus Geothermincolia bacterium]
MKNHHDYSEGHHPPPDGAGDAVSIDEAHAHEVPRGLKSKLRKYLYGNMTLLGILSLAWLIVRTGRKPTRINYPCQRAAFANATILLGGAALPIAARLPRTFLGERSERTPWIRKVVGLTEAAAAVAIVVAIILTITGTGGPPGRPMGEMKAAAASLALPELRSTAADASNIYIAENIPPASEHGVDYLIQVMAGNGLDFFQSANAGAAAGPTGLVGKNDVVLIKVNGEWRWRGETNSDVVKGLVNAIVHHPDGFTGEVVIVENGQWDSYMDNLPNNQNPDAANAEDTHQSFNDVAMMFAAQGHRVSVYDWTQVQTNDVNEFGSGDGRDGYVYVPEIEEGYPKFTTPYGTQISLRYGVWTGAAYENARVKMLNVPVLKDHGNMPTNAVKHWMGVQDLWKRTNNAPHTPMVSEGIFGKVMLKSHFPELNISDCIWVTPAGGPNAPYDKAVRLNRLVASPDPIALDYYCGKYVLEAISGNPAHDPIASPAFNQMLSTTRDVLAAGGKQVTTDESKMNVYKVWAPDVPPTTKYQYYLAEGCTAYGFDTWVLVANPNDNDATINITYLTEMGALNKAPVVVPAHSRMTANAASDAWAMNTGVRVGSDLPVYVERSMYWNDKVEGHDSIGTSSGSQEWYLADGHTSDGFETWTELLNPGTVATTATLTYLTPSGEVPGPTVSIAPYARVTVRANDTVAAGDVSTHVISASPVVAEHSLYWDNRRGGMGSSGVKVPSQTWYFAEGATHSGFETYVLLLNTQATDANVTLDLMTSTSKATGSKTKSLVVPAGTRRTVKLNDVVAGVDVATAVHSDIPIVAERSMLWPAPGGRAGHETAGMTSPSKEIFMPEGCTAYGFETWLLLQNPGTTGSSATVYAMTAAGEKKLFDVNLASGGRATFRLNDYYQGNLSIRVQATTAVAAERAIYWNGRGGGTSSIGYAK